jgi:hypothetical protein
MFHNIRILPDPRRSGARNNPRAPADSTTHSTKALWTAPPSRRKSDLSTKDAGTAENIAISPILNAFSDGFF